MRSEVVSLFVLASFGAANAAPHDDPHPPPPPPPPHQPPPPPVVSQRLASLTTNLLFQGHTFQDKARQNMSALIRLRSYEVQPRAKSRLVPFRLISKIQTVKPSVVLGVLSR